MTRRDVYDSPEWASLRERILARDGRTCLLARLGAAGVCAGPLHVHHIEPIEERPDLAFEPSNLVSSCAGHHPMLESLRRWFRSRSRSPWRRCPHRHTNRAGREACERSLNQAA